MVMHYIDEANKKERISNLLENHDGKVDLSVMYEKAMEFAVKKSRAR